MVDLNYFWTWPLSSNRVRLQRLANAGSSLNHCGMLCTSTHIQCLPFVANCYMFRIPPSYPRIHLPLTSMLNLFYGFILWYSSRSSSISKTCLLPIQIQTMLGTPTWDKVNVVATLGMIVRLFKSILDLSFDFLFSPNIIFLSIHMVCSVNEK